MPTLPLSLRTSHWIAFSTVIAAFFAVEARALEPGTVSLRAGYSHTNFDDWGAADPDGHAWQVFVSYAWSPLLALELGWLDASRVSGRVTDAPITIFPDERTVEARAMTLGPRLQGRLPGGFNIYVTAGYQRSSHFYRRVGGTLITPDFTNGETRHDDEIFYGGGVGYALTERAGIQLDYRRLEFSDLPMHNLALLVSWRFGGA
jgi:opacity protein-like surface antigen